jgi:hypothetical protein
MHHTKHMSRDRYLLLLCDVTARALHSNGPSADIENTVLVLLAACVLRALSSNGQCLQIYCLSTGLFARIYTFYVRRYMFSLTGSSSGNTLFKESTALCTFVNSILNVRSCFYVTGCLLFLSPHCGCFMSHWACRYPWLCVSCEDLCFLYKEHKSTKDTHTDAVGITTG